MNDSTGHAGCCHFELKIEIDASADRVWKAIFEEAQQWWLPEFHVVDTNSAIHFDPQPGGPGLMETTEDDGALQWYTVQMHLPSQRKIFLVGHIAPDWGGPMTSHLMLAVEESESGCTFKLVDARNGNVDEKYVQLFKDGWTQLFTDGLKAYVESR